MTEHAHSFVPTLLAGVVVACALWIAATAARESALRGLACLLVWPYTLYYSLSRFGRCWLPALAGALAAAGIIGWAVQQPADVGQTRWQSAAAAMSRAFGAEDKSALLRQSELARLGGVWNVDSERSVFFQGRPAVGESVVVDGDHCLIASFSQQHELRVEIDPERSPKWIDFVPPDGGAPVRGIYLVTGGKWRLCVAAEGAARPTFFGDEADRQWFFVLHRDDTADRPE